MAHVQFRTGASTTNGHLAQFVVDGTDLTEIVLADGFSIDIGDPLLGVKPQIRFAVLVDDLDLDLPDSVIAALSKQGRGDDRADAR